jgi:hypothetical protein
MTQDQVRIQALEDRLERLLEIADKQDALIRQVLQQIVQTGSR